MTEQETELASVVSETARRVGESVDRAIDELTGVPAPEQPPRTFSYAGASLLVEERGNGTATFVLVHGIGMGRKVFGALTAILATHGRVLAIDLPGYGEAPEPRRVLTMERTADLVAALIRDRGIRPVVVGHSMGTQVVVELAARHPHLVDRVVLVAPTVDVRHRTTATQLWRLFVDLLDESPKVLLLGAREYLRAGPKMRDKLRSMMVHRPERTMPRVQAPALVLRGENDNVSPHDWCEQVVHLLPDARLDEVPDHGHETMIKDPRPAAALILDWCALT